jgi:hypothetical protein
MTKEGDERVAGDAMALGGVERILNRALLTRGTMLSRCPWPSMVDMVFPKITND